ncbi:RNA-annealing mlo3 [Hyphodiscus hymeniophilus]|uniref:RNA-annealing mlo3 n=1 Tax=Hyphodiscus hymeniophilus TaxID=353542 RepID=A0A9P6SKP1_9HELO|nr:RNA-annealing mlo3 [Hyphodiscus hymeniophilus]
MSGKLDQSLDDILKTSRRSTPKGARGRGGRRVGRGGRAAVAAPVGGVKKTTKPAKGSALTVPTGPSGRGESKVQVSNLPRDITEKVLKDFFSQTCGPIKRVDISYGPGGVSRGSATIIFQRSDGAASALDKCNGLLVDNKFKMKVEIILDAQRALALPAPKGLSERITAPKAQPKSAVPAKNGPAGTRGKGRGAKKTTTRAPRAAKKTAEELDSEMADYWQSGAAGEESTATNGAAAPATGDAMEEIL